MTFDAIVHAPELRAGARVNIAQANQCVDQPVERIATGAEVRVRFGVCCPNKAQGTIIDHSSEPDAAVLAIGKQTWPLRRGAGGIATAGLVSEYWYVAEP